MKLKVVVICVYFGRLPSFKDFVFKTIAHNPGIDMLLFTDQDLESKYDNLKISSLTIADFEVRVSRLLGLDTRLARPYKCCDYKPAYGLIFQDMIKQYDYWAFSDIDMLWGNFPNFLEGWLEYFDIVSTHSGRLNGPLSFFKNTETCNRVFLDVPELQQKLNAERYMHIDEVEIERVLNNRKDLSYSRREVGARDPTFWRNGCLYDSLTGKESMIFHLHGPLLQHKCLRLDVNKEAVCRVDSF
jgi:hypothetical protein